MGERSRLGRNDAEAWRTPAPRQLASRRCAQRIASRAFGGSLERPKAPRSLQLEHCFCRTVSHFSEKCFGLATLLSVGFAAEPARAQSVQLDPAGSNVILTAVTWLQGTLLGNVATALAVIAVGATGLLMLTGRIDWRRGATVILGCFIVFGAAAIVAGIRSVAAGS